MITVIYCVMHLSGYPSYTDSVYLSPEAIEYFDEDHPGSPDNLRQRVCANFDYAKEAESQSQ